ncbi:hypothetical protein C5167_042358, partial [Papaver somniferum]
PLDLGGIYIEHKARVSYFLLSFFRLSEKEKNSIRITGKSFILNLLFSIRLQLHEHQLHLHHL